jgi:hypothetical protein
MGQRHNRRRTRPRSRNRGSRLDLVQSFSFRLPEHDYQAPIAASPVRMFPEFVVLSPFAHIRHPWCREWQISEYTDYHLGAHTLNDQQQFRYFGGEPGDDADLCYNMMDFFDRLDYIDS